MSLEKELARKTDPIDYNKSVIKAIDIFTSKEHPRIIYGSSVYRVALYAGDIDLMQDIKTHYHSKTLYKIANQIVKHYELSGFCDYFIGDIKCGVHPLYGALDMYIGKIKNCRLVDFDYDNLINLAHQYELIELYDIPKNITIGMFPKYYKIVHELTTLRWTIDEVLNKKKIIGDIVLSLDNACLNSKLTKIDGFFFNGNRYSEITCSLIDTPENMYEKVSENMFLQLNQETPNYTKAIKRAFTLARMKHNDELLKKIIPFLQSNINLLASASTDLTTISDIMKYNKRTMNWSNFKKYLDVHLDTVLTKFTNVYVVSLPDDYVFYLKHIKKSSMIDHFDYIVYDVKQSLNILSLNYIQKYNINFKLLC